MKHLEVVRSYLPSATIGTMSLPDSGILQTLERPWLNNESGVSCIPEGTYIVSRDRSGKYQYYSINNVPNRTFIEIHPANHVIELQGCLTLGLSRASNNVSVNGSRLAIDLLMEEVGDDDFLLTFRSFNPNTDEVTK